MCYTHKNTFTCLSHAYHAFYLSTTFYYYLYRAMQILSIVTVTPECHPQLASLLLDVLTWAALIVLPNVVFCSLPLVTWMASAFFLPSPFLCLQFFNLSEHECDLHSSNSLHILRQKSSFFPLFLFLLRIILCHCLQQLCTLRKEIAIRSISLAPPFQRSATNLA